MFKHLLLSLVLVGVCSPSFAQIYRAGEPSHKETVPFPKLELSVGAFGNTDRLKDGAASSLVKGAYGLEGRALVGVLPWLAIGAEGAFSQSRDNEPILNKYRFETFGAAAKFTLTPGALSRTYLLLGLGQARYKVDYLRTAHSTADSNYLSLGVGAETDLTEHWFAGLELRTQYRFDTDVSPYFHLSHHWTAALSLRTGVQF